MIAIHMPLRTSPLKSIVWFFTRPRLDGISCILKCGNDVLLVNYKYGNGWNFPTGLIRKSHETPLDAVQRELFQVFSIKIPPPQYIGFVFCRYQNRRDRVYCFFTETSNKNMLISHKDVRDAQWFPIENLPRISPFSRDIIERWFKKRRY